MLKPLALGALVALTALADPAVAQEDAPRRIVVTGTGEIRARPDIAVISAGVVVQSETASAALAENSRAMNAVLQQLRTSGLAGEDVQTSQFSVTPLYERQPPERETTAPPRIVGYQVANQVTARVRDIDRLGAVLDTLVSAGADEHRRPVVRHRQPRAAAGRGARRRRRRCGGQGQTLRRGGRSRARRDHLDRGGGFFRAAAAPDDAGRGDGRRRPDRAGPDGAFRERHCGVRDQIGPSRMRRTDD